jgi:hypothetical protein
VTNYTQRVNTKRIRDLQIRKCLIALLMLRLWGYLISQLALLSRAYTLYYGSIVLDYMFCRPLVHFVCSVSFVIWLRWYEEPNKPDKLNRPNKQARVADPVTVVREEFLE